MSFEYIYNNVTKYKDVDKDTDKDIKVDIINRKKDNK